MLVCVTVFGCQMNKLDGDLVREALQDAGHAITQDEDAADAVLYVTCAVRDHAERRVISRLARLAARKREKPELLLGVLGCFAERRGPGGLIFNDCPGIDLVVGTRHFPDIADHLEFVRQYGPLVTIGEAEFDYPGIGPAHERARHKGVGGFVSVMRGCDNRCAYCVVPGVRGPEESRPPDAILQETENLVRRGAREVTLLGQNIDAYGKGTDTNLARLLRRIHDRIPREAGLLRLRFVTSHPRDITEELARTVAELPRVGQHFHMPAQSGSTDILRRMGRGYDADEYDRKLELVRRAAPAASVASDFIVGFPGESEADFQRTLALVERARFQNSFVFKYSPRPGTRAAEEFADDVPEGVKKERHAELLRAQNGVNAKRNRSLVGTRQRILVEGVSPRDAGRLTGRTSANAICVFPAPEEGCGAGLVGDEVDLEITGATTLTLAGRLA